MPSPFITQIRETLEALTSGMTVSGGYFLDWGTGNVWDEAEMVYPALTIHWDEDEAQTEDEEENIGHNLFENSGRLVVIGHGSLQVTPSHPRHAEQQTKLLAEKMHADILKRLGDVAVMGDAGYHPQYSRTKFFYQAADGYAKVETRWKIKYSHDRTNVTQAGA